MIGQDLAVLVQSVGIQLCNDRPDQAVQVLPPLTQQCPVGDVLGQRMLEHIGQFGEISLLVD